MSKLDKEAVLEEFTAAYKAANGKAPNVEFANGWYSVDGGKNMRLAQLDEWAQELKGGAGSKKAADKPAAKSSTKPSAKKATSTQAKKPAAKKPASTSKKDSKKSGSATGGLTAKELWRQRLEQQAGEARLPRGVRQA